MSSPPPNPIVALGAIGFLQDYRAYRAWKVRSRSQTEPLTVQQAREEWLWRAYGVAIRIALLLFLAFTIDLFTVNFIVDRNWLFATVGFTEIIAIWASIGFAHRAKRVARAA